MENKLLGELLGFIALSAPLIALVLILVGLVTVVWWFARSKQGTSRRWSRAVIAGAAFLLIFTWDVILGRVYFYSLCAIEGGGNVYKAIKLPAEYWNDDGSPKFILPNGNIELTDQFSFKTISDENYSKIFRIERDTKRIVELQFNQLVATYTVFSYFGGWLVNNMGIFHVTGTHCPKGRGEYTHFLHEVFINSKDSSTRR